MAERSWFDEHVMVIPVTMPVRHRHKADRPCPACAAGEVPDGSLCWNCGMRCEGCAGDEVVR